MIGIDAVDAGMVRDQTFVVGVSKPEPGKSDTLKAELHGFLEGLFEPHAYNGNSIELKPWEKEQKLNAYLQWISGKAERNQFVYADTDANHGITSVERGKSGYTVSHNILGVSGSGKDESEARGNLSKAVLKHLLLVKKFFHTVPDAKSEFGSMVKTVAEARYVKFIQDSSSEISP